MTQEQKLDIINGYIKAYNQMDVPAMVSFLHEDIIFHTVNNGQYAMSVNGRAEFEALALQTLQLFSVRRQTATQTEFNGSTGSAKIDYEGTLAIDMPGFGKAGEVITFKGRSEFIFQNNLIHRLTDYN